MLPQRNRSRLRSSASFVAVALAVSVMNCSNEKPRPQLVVHVDTDLPTTGEAAVRAELSADAAIDAVRLDAVDSADEPRTFIVPDKDDWPLSFGVAVPAGRKSVRLRLRAFRSSLVKDEDPTSPQAQVTVDRIIDLDLPSEGVEDVRVVLRGDCMGVLPSFSNPATTCIDADHRTGAPSDGVEKGDRAARVESSSGTWGPAVEEKCANDPPPGARCIAGGFTLLGDDQLRGFADGTLTTVDPIPVRPVHLTPFFLDTFELTVGRFRRIMKEHPSLLDAVQPPGSTLVNAKCTLIDLDTTTNDELPLNCVHDTEAARLICQADGGDLPTEAQWEHAARGRGRHHDFAWGDESPDCCHGNFLPCGDDVKASSDIGCDGFGDVTPDGIHDMTGNLREITLDRFADYADTCWNVEGVPQDPFCDDHSISSHTIRGAGFNQSFDTVHLSFRGSIGGLETAGVRCAYIDSL